MNTNDHTVPQMYLRRFAERKGSRHFISARRIEDIETVRRLSVRNVTAVNGFYWATSPEGVPHHEFESVLGQIEGDATPVFAAMLDDPHYALPFRWPLEDYERACLSYWIAAQLLRTTRQRKRLAHLADERSLGATANVRSMTESNRHLDYLARQLGGLAFILYNRPWGLAFSDACLLTSDVPVVILNGHDDRHQALAASFWDIVLPLDPHRFLYLPNRRAQEEDPRKSVDHAWKLDGGMGTFLGHVLHDAADGWVLHHPQHVPNIGRIAAGPRLPTPWTGDERTEGPEYIIEYEVLSTNQTVERRWLTHRPAASPQK